MMKFRHILLVMVLLLAGWPLNAMDEQEFWDRQPKELADRYSLASNYFHEDWVPAFADSLKTLAHNGNGMFNYFSAELLCHHAYNNCDTLTFFDYSHQAQKYALEYGLLPYYFSELFNEASFCINVEKYAEAQKVARKILEDYKKLDFPKGAYYGYYALGAMYSSRGIHYRAIESLSGCIDIIKDDEINAYALASIYEMISSEYIGLRDYDNAIKYGLMSKETADLEEDVDAYLAIAYFHKGDYAQFADCCDRYFSNTENSSISYNFCLNYLSGLKAALDKDYDLAGEYADKVYEAGGDHDLHSEICKLKGDWQGAINYLQADFDATRLLLNSNFEDDLEQYGRDLDDLAIQFSRRQSMLLVILVFVVLLALSAVMTIWALKNKKIVALRDKELEATRQLVYMAEKADKAKTAFVQNMSHEIRTPLNAIVGFSQLLSMPSDFVSDEERNQYASVIQNNSDLLMMLINDILDISETDVKGYKLDISKSSCNEICRNAIKTVNFRVPEGVEVNFSSELDDDYMIESDPHRLQQILINYLTNAYKNTSEGHVNVKVSKSENPGSLTFSVEDTGIGVDPRMAENIFQRFTKIDQFKQGVGLGLNICLNIANALGATVRLDTSYSPGARFVLIVPEK